MTNHGVVLGGGEIGSAYAKILDDVAVVDIDPAKCKGKPKKGGVLHVCLRYTPDFEAIVRGAIADYKPKALNVMTTCPPGTTARFEPTLPSAHSTTRGLHPNLLQSILTITKHIGGPGARLVAEVFEGVIPLVLHDHSRTTELAHIASNFQYFANIAWADEVDVWARHYGVDFVDIMRYCETHNSGYGKMGLHSKVRPVVWPSGGKIGGHCVKLAAELIPKELHGPLTKRLAEYK